MTLKEKICEPFGGLRTETANQLEQIADDFAIDFAEWMFNLTIREWENESTDDLLRYYKKEKGL